MTALDLAALDDVRHLPTCGGSFVIDLALYLIPVMATLGLVLMAI